MAWICNWLMIVMQMVVLVIISAENITTTTSPTNPTTSTTLPTNPTTSTTTNTPTMASTTPPVSQHTTPDQKTITITSVTLGLLVSLAIVGILALILLLFLLFRVLYLRMRTPDREAEQDPNKRLVGSSSYRRSTGPEFSVSPVEIFPVEEEVCPVGKEDLDLLLINELPRKNMQTSDVVHADETKLDDDNVNNEYHETATLPMGNKGGKDIPEEDNVYVNASSSMPKGRKLSNPSILPDGVLDFKMPTLPPGSTETGTLVEEPRDSKIYDIPFDHSHPAHVEDEPPSEYTYVDPPPVLKHVITAEITQNEDDNDSVNGLDYTYIPDFSELTGESEDEHASVHGSDDDDDYHEYTDPKEMTGVASPSYKPTTNHYNNNQMFKTEGRKGHTHRAKEDI